MTATLTRWPARACLRTVPESATDLTRVVVDVPEEILTDLRDRLRRRRLPGSPPGTGWRYGTDPTVLDELLDRWAEEYDWRAAEAAMNRWEHVVTEIAGVGVHALVARSPHPGARPLVLTHGWPWTFWDYRDLLGPLTHPVAFGGDVADAFEVVVPSLPGFGFSADPPPGTSWVDTAALWVELMHRLGHGRFLAAGGDFGAAVTSQLGHAHAEHVQGVHLFGGFPLEAWNNERPWDMFGPVPRELPDELRAAVLAWQARFAAHIAVQTLDPQSLGIGLADSPAGLAGWLLERRRAWSDCGGKVFASFTPDDLLTGFTLYWATGTITSSMRFYYEAARCDWRPAHPGPRMVDVPTGLSLFPADRHPVARGPQWREAYYRLVNLAEHEVGGHFAPAEEPGLVLADLRRTFREVPR